MHHHLTVLTLVILGVLAVGMCQIVDDDASKTVVKKDDRPSGLEQLQKMARFNALESKRCLKRDANGPVEYRVKVKGGDGERLHIRCVGDTPEVVACIGELDGMYVKVGEAQRDERMCLHRCVVGCRPAE